VNVTILRDKKSSVLPVRLGNIEDATKALVLSVEERLEAGFRPATVSEQNKYGLSASQGIAITRVNLKGPLGVVGFEGDDIIAEINGQGVGSMEVFAEIVSSFKPGSKVTFLAIDHNTGNSGEVAVTIK
jgi:S1-C subfamily serine protease